MRHFIVSALIGVLLTIQNPAMAEPAGPKEYLAQGDFGNARRSLRVLVQGRSDASLHMAYLEAQILLRQNRIDEAIEVFRDILTRAPDYEPARRELTLVLAHRGNVTGAVYHAERLVAQTADTRLREQLQNYILNNSTQDPGGVSLRFGFFPSSNQTRGSAAQSVIIGGLPFLLDPRSQATAGVGISIGATVWHRWNLLEKWAGLGSASLDTKFYSGHLETETTAIARFDLIRTGERGRISFGPVIELSFLASDIARRRVGAEARGLYVMSPRQQLSASLRYDGQQYDVTPVRDGERLLGSLSYQNRLSPSLSFSIGLTQTREKTQRLHLDHVETGLLFGLEKNWRNGLTTGAVITRSRDRFDGKFPGTTSPRNDSISSLSLTLQHNKLRVGRYVPQLNYTYTRAKSNVPLFDYDSHDVGMIFSTKF